MGSKYLRARPPDKARAVFDRALKAKPGDVDALLGKVSAMVALADRNGALALLEAAARHNPDRQLLRRQAGLLTADGRPAEAITALKAILTRHPDDEDAAWDLAYDLFNQGEVDDAIRVLAPFESKAGVKVQIGRFRAHSATRQGRRDEAINLLHETVRLEPDNPINLRNRARWFTEAGQHERALADLEEAHRMDPMDLEVIKERAEVFAAMGRPVDAIAALDDGVARYRSSAQSLNNRCWVRALIGRQLAEAEADCQAALKLRPDTPNILGSYALVALRAGRFDEAVKRYDRSLEKGPKRATALYGRGLAKLRLGDENGGQADLAAAKAINARVSGEYDRHGIKPGDREAPR